MASPTTNVTFTTDYGAFVVTLLPDAAPLSVANFLYYVENLTSGYNVSSSFFHRLVPGFVLQGGGYYIQNGQAQTLPTQAAVASEVSPSRPNVAGTIAFATVGNDPNTGTSQFFFNLVDNPSLNTGFTVFGSVTSGFSVVQAIAGLATVNAGGAFTDLPLDRGASTSTPNYQRDVVDYRVSLNLGVNDVTRLNPFAQATVSDTAASETVTISYPGANGTFAGGGFSGSAGSYSFTGTPAQVTAALRALTFTPAANQVAPGQTVTSTFSLGISSSGGSRTDTSFSVSALSVNDVPALVGAASGQAASPGTALSPFTSIRVVDPDVGQTLTVAITFSAANGALFGAGLSGSAGSYTLTAASAAQAQAALRALTFTPAPGVNAVTSFAVSVSDGMSSTSTTDASVIASGAPGANAPSVTSGFSAVEAPNVIRALPNGAGALNPGSPIYAQYQAQRAIAAQLDGGQITQAQADLALAHLVDGTTSVAVASYGFFTGRTPSLAGLNYLVNSSANPTDLNDPYYVRFTTENRYINFAANLGVVGAGQAKFSADYGALDLRASTAKAYQAVFGVAADAAKVSALLDTQVPNGLGGTFTRADYFAQFGGDGLNGQGTKAAMIGFLLSNAVVANDGAYGKATVNYVMALEHGAVPANDVPLVPDYVSAVSLVGQQPTADPTVSG